MYMSILSYANLEIQIYGHTLKMEIKFELEDSDLDCVFEPEFDININCCDIERVAWKFQDGTHTRTMASLFSGTPEHEYPTTRLPPIV